MNILDKVILGGGGVYLVSSCKRLVGGLCGEVEGVPFGLVKA